MYAKTHIFFYSHLPKKTIAQDVENVHVFSQWYPSIFEENIANTTIRYYNANNI